ncbi:hypothetical protein DNG35_09800 [Mesonia sp. K7]|nr:hypothetical protein DNG35_09800 [Mesonia sp. K7]
MKAQAQQVVYFNDFEANSFPTNGYTGSPTTHPYISSSSWTNSSNTNFTDEVGYNNSVGMGLNLNGSFSYFLTLTIAPGYEIQIDAYNFWREKNQANAGWEMKINGNSVDSGDTQPDGDFISTTPKLANPPLPPFSGTVTIEIKINGNGNGLYIIDDFSLYAVITPECPEAVSFPDKTLCEGNAWTIAIENPAVGSTFQWQVNVGGFGTWTNLSNDFNYSGVDTAILQIQDIPTNFNNNLYRCVITKTACATVETIPVALTVIPLPQTPNINYN